MHTLGCQDAYICMPHHSPTAVHITMKWNQAVRCAGQVVAGFVAIVAVAIFAVPTSILGGGFMQAVQRSQGRDLTFDCD